MATIIDMSYAQDWQWPMPTGIDYDRIAELHEAGEVVGVIVRAHAYGPFADIRAGTYIKEIGANRGVPLAVYGNYNPWYSPVTGAEKFKQMIALRGVTGITVGSLTFKVMAAGESSRSGYPKQQYSDNWFQYATLVEADGIYGSANTHNVNVGGADNSWMASFKKWVAHYTSASSPLLPSDWSTWDLWQWSADGNGQGPAYGMVSASLDLDRWHPRYDVVAPPAELTLDERVGRLEKAVFG